MAKRLSRREFLKISAFAFIGADMSGDIIPNLEPIHLHLKWEGSKNSLICGDWLRADVEVICDVRIIDDVKASCVMRNLRLKSLEELVMLKLDGQIRCAAAEKPIGDLLSNNKAFAREIIERYRDDVFLGHGLDVEKFIINIKPMPVDKYDPNNGFDRVALNILKAREDFASE